MDVFISKNVKWLVELIFDEIKCIYLYIIYTWTYNCYIDVYLTELAGLSLMEYFVCV